jgi:hypothetical protein
VRERASFGCQRCCSKEALLTVDRVYCRLLAQALQSSAAKRTEDLKIAEALLMPGEMRKVMLLVGGLALLR